MNLELLEQLITSPRVDQEEIVVSYNVNLDRELCNNALYSTTEEILSKDLDDKFSFTLYDGYVKISYNPKEIDITCDGMVTHVKDILKNNKDKIVEAWNQWHK
jgi:hypothetical protein